MYNQPQEFKRILRSVAEPMENLESVASTAVINILFKYCFKYKHSPLLLFTFHINEYCIVCYCTSNPMSSSVL